MSISENFLKKRELQYIEKVSNDGLFLKYIKNQTDEICKKAIENNCFAIQYVQNKTEDLCKLAIKHCPMTLEYIDNQTDTICQMALISEPYTLQFIKNDNHNYCKLAMKYNVTSVQFCKHQKEFLPDIKEKFNKSYYKQSIVKYINKELQDIDMITKDVEYFKWNNIKYFRHDILLNKKIINMVNEYINYLYVTYHSYNNKDIYYIFKYMNKDFQSKDLCYKAIKMSHTLKILKYLNMDYINLDIIDIILKKIDLENLKFLKYLDEKFQNIQFYKLAISKLFKYNYLLKYINHHINRKFYNSLYMYLVKKNKYDIYYTRQQNIIHYLI